MEAPQRSAGRRIGIGIGRRIPTRRRGEVAGLLGPGPDVELFQRNKKCKTDRDRQNDSVGHGEKIVRSSLNLVSLKVFVYLQ